MHFDLTNVGNLPLEIRTVTSSSSELISGWPGKVTLAPGEGVPLAASYQFSKARPFKGTLTVKTSSRVTGTMKLAVTAQVVEAPRMLVQPESVTETVFPGTVKDTALEVRNSGDAPLKWTAEVVNEIGSPASAGSLAQVLQRLDGRHASLTDLIPDRHDFTEGSSGYSITDGGGNMYNTGNLFSTNLNGGQAVAYSDGTVAVDASLGASSRYFTRKQPGLFVMAADLAGVSALRIRGGTGADGGGSATGTVLHRHGYVGFFKRVSGASTPSVNHLIILPKQSGLEHSFPTNTALDNHDITGLPASTRLYVLVFSASAGRSVTDMEVRQIMDQFLLNIVHDAGTAWLQVMMSMAPRPSPSPTRMPAPTRR